MTSIKKFFDDLPVVNYLKPSDKRYKDVLIENKRKDLLEDFSPCASYVKERLEGIIGEFIAPEMLPYIYITGGSISSLIDEYLNAQEINKEKAHYGDVDFWLKSIPPKSARIAQYRKWKDWEQYDGSEDYPIGMKIRKAFTFILAENCISSDRTIEYFSSLQFIVKFIDTPEQNVARFDFEHCKAIYDPSLKKLYISPEQMYSILYKKLIPSAEAKLNIDKFLKFDKLVPKLIDNIPEEFQEVSKETLKRVNKYYKRGYKL